jgi:hypothetical protein
MGAYDHTIEQLASAEIGATSAPTRSGVADKVVAWAPEVLTLLLYGGMLAIMVPRHEPWADEAQAWQIARTLPYWKMISHYLGYEGAPGLWYTLLWVLTRVGVSYAGMQWISAGIAFVGVAVFLYSAPFPRYLKLAVPFTYFVAYQYAVVARSYVVFPLIFFLTLRMWPRKRESPMTFALLLGLMANISLHTAMVSGGFALVALLELWCENQTISQLLNLRLLSAVCLLLSLYTLAIAVAKPPPDQNFFSSPIMTLGVPASASARPLTAEPIGTARQGFASSLARAPFRAVATACQPGFLSEIPLVNLLFWIAFFVTFFNSGRLIYTAPVLFVLGFSAYLYAAFHHCGIAYLAVAGVFWLAWDESFLRRHVVVFALFLLMTYEQVVWAFVAEAYDYSHPFSPDIAAATFVKPYVDSGATIAIVGAPLACYSTGLEPYFDHNIYVNQRLAFWWWSSQNDGAANVQSVIARHTDLVLVEYVATEPFSLDFVRTISPDFVSEQLKALSESGYRHTATFCGARPEGFRLSEWICHLVFVRQSHRAEDFHSLRSPRAPSKSNRMEVWRRSQLARALLSEFASKIRKVTTICGSRSRPRLKMSNSDRSSVTFRAKAIHREICEQDASEAGSRAHGER